MNSKVLVTYASKYGATKEIAERIIGVLAEAGLAAELQPVNAVSALDDYEAFVIGSAVYAGQWRKEAAAFLEENETVLTENPVWIFSSGPTGEGDPVELMDGWRFPEGLQPLADRIEPRDIEFFGGNLDPEKLNFAEKLLVKGIKAPTGDFRDWEHIDAWATGIAVALMNGG